MRVLGRIVKSVIFLIALAGVIVGVTYVLQPRMSPFYQEKQWDAIFFGTSQSYCSFDPVIFEEYNLHTYNRGMQQQPMNYTYYYVKDALETSQTNLVVLEIFGMFYGDEENGYPYDASICDSSMNELRYSKTKMEAILACVPEEQQRQYLFPLDKYHSNWENFDYSSLKNLYADVTRRYYVDEDRGYKRWGGAEACGYASWEELFSEERGEIYSENFNYLQKIYDLCEEHGATLVLVKAPFPYWNGAIEKTNTVADWADEHGVELINLMRVTDQYGLDCGTDSLDGGGHLNVSGAAKVSAYLAEYLCENYIN